MPGQREEKPLLVNVPPHLPVLNQDAARVLLAILEELTTVDVLDGFPEGAPHDS
jgi:hypothetical protein